MSNLHDFIIANAYARELASISTMMQIKKMLGFYKLDPIDPLILGLL
jgi:hypothetical protein